MNKPDETRKQLETFRKGGKKKEVLFTTVSLLPLFIFIMFFAMFFARGVFVDNVRPVEEVMKVHGYTEYTITDKDIFFINFRGCQLGEAAKFEVSAVNSNGESVNLLVCTGWPFKGATIRVDW